MNLKRWIRDLFRGYSDADVKSLKAKICRPIPLEPGSVTPLTKGEMNALLFAYDEWSNPD